MVKLLVSWLSCLYHSYVAYIIADAYVDWNLTYEMEEIHDQYNH
jgi:hypothetical protein